MKKKPIHWLQVFGCFILAIMLIFAVAGSADLQFYLLVIGTLLSLVLIGIGEVASQLNALINRERDKSAPSGKVEPSKGDSSASLETAEQLENSKFTAAEKNQPMKDEKAE